MDLKELLGEELYNQVAEKAGDNKIAVVSDGSYIPKDKFNTKNDEVKDLKAQLKERDDQLDDLSKKAKGSEELQQEIATLKQANEEEQSKWQQKLERTQKEAAVKLQLGSQLNDPEDALQFIKIDELKLDGEKVLGLDDRVNELKEKKSYLFKQQETPAGLKGREPHTPSADKGKKSFSMEDIAKMTPEEINKNWDSISQK